MSEKNNVNSKSSIEDEFLKKNLPSPSTSKICPRCGKVYTDDGILFCYYDGTRLTLNPQPIQVPNNTPTQYSSEFGGFELNLQNTAHNIQIPVEIFQSSLRLLQSNPRMPVESENVKTWFWSIPSPKRNRNFLIKLVNNVAFSRTNLFAYFVCYLLILATYVLWVANVDNSLFAEFTADKPYNFLLVGGISFVVLITLILPILSLGYTESDILQASRKDFYLKIEPTLIITIVILNYLIFRFGGPLPIIIIPGEPKVKVAPPKEHLVNAIKRSVYPSLFIAITTSAMFFIVYFEYIKTSTFILMNFEITALFVTTILILELMPFGSSIGKIILKSKPVFFYVSFLIMTTLLMSIISMVKIP